jgi:hypothetical protein
VGATLTSFNGWADAWGNSWGSGNPNEMRGSASFSINAYLTVNTGEMIGSASMTFTATLTLPFPPRGEVILKRRRYYVRKNGKVLLFETASEADSYIDSEHNAELAAMAKTSRRARKRVRDAAVANFTPEVLDLEITECLAEKFGMVKIPDLVEQMDWDRLMYIQNLSMELEEEEDSSILAALPY